MRYHLSNAIVKAALFSGLQDRLIRYARQLEHLRHITPSSIEFRYRMFPLFGSSLRCLIQNPPSGRDTNNRPFSTQTQSP